MLTDPGGEYQIVEPPQIHGEGADVVDDAGDEHIKGELCPLIAVLRGLDHIAQVVRHTGDAQQTALFLQPL